MKKTVLLFFFILASLAGSAQILDPVKWTSTIEKKSDSEYVLIFDGEIEENWHVYSQFTAEGGVLPLEVLFDNAEGNFEPVGKAEESETKKPSMIYLELRKLFLTNMHSLNKPLK